MRLIKNQTTNSRSIIGNGLKYNSSTDITTLDGTVMLTPQGTSAERPDGIDGYFRFNTEYGQLEYFFDGQWRWIATGNSDGTLVNQTMYSGFDSFQTVFGPLDPKDTTYFVKPAAERTVVFVEKLYQTPFTDYDIVEDPLDQGLGGEITANNVVQGKTYYIVDPGTTDWTRIGSTDNMIQTEFVATYTTSIGTTETIANPNTSTNGDQFGYTLDVNDTYIIVGAPYENDVPNNEVQAGAAYIYTYNGGLVTKFSNPRSYGTSSLDWFGYSVGINNLYAAVGSYKEDDTGFTGQMSGKAYLYDLNTVTGVPLHTFNNPDMEGDYDDWFGYAIAMSETHLIVTAPRADDNGPSTPLGKAYIYDLSDYTAAPIEIKNPIAFADGGLQFGMSVTLNDAYAFVGTPSQNAVYMFDVRTGDYIGPIINPNGDPSDEFGLSVDVGDNLLIVGAPQTDNVYGNNSGKAYVYDIKGPAPTEVKYSLDNPNVYIPEADDKFGYKVAISDNFAVVSAHLEDDVGTMNPGRVYVFDTADGELLNHHLNPNAFGTGANDNYGTSLAVTNTHMIVGAHNEDNATASSSGAIYVNEIVGKGTGTGLCREKGAYIKFVEPLNAGPVLKHRDSDNKVHIEFDFEVNNLTISILYHTEASIVGMQLADRWTFARTIQLAGDAAGSVEMDGTSDVILNVQVQNDSHEHTDKANINGSVTQPFNVQNVGVASDWTIAMDGTNLVFKYQGTIVGQIDSAGNYTKI